MVGALIIVFREVLEAGLIVGIVLAATRGVAGRARWICIGIGAGVLGAALVAAFAGVISEAFEGSGQELLNAAVLFTAVVMLMWHNAWMARHGREIAAELHKVGVSVAEGTRSLAALAVVVGLAVLREGSEIVLFLYGIVAAGTSEMDVLIGGLLGIVAGAAVSALTYFGLLTIPQRHIFMVTTVLISLLAAGMAAQGIQFLYAAGFIDVLGTTLWDTSSWLPESGILGRVLHALIGYTERPTQLQIIIYIATLAGMAALMKVAAPARRPTPALRQS